MSSATQMATIKIQYLFQQQSTTPGYQQQFQLANLYYLQFAIGSRFSQLLLQPTPVGLLQFHIQLLSFQPSFPTVHNKMFISGQYSRVTTKMIFSGHPLSSDHKSVLPRTALFSDHKSVLLRTTIFITLYMSLDQFTQTFFFIFFLTKYFSLTKMNMAIFIFIQIFVLFVVFRYSIFVYILLYYLQQCLQ